MEGRYIYIERLIYLLYSLLGMKIHIGFHFERRCTNSLDEIIEIIAMHKE